MSRYFSTGLLVAVDDPATGQIVGGQLHDDAILWEDANVVLTHLARDVGEHLVSVGQLNAEHRVGQSLDNLALDFDDAVFFGQILCIALSKSVDHASAECRVRGNAKAGAKHQKSILYSATANFQVRFSSVSCDHAARMGGA